MNLSLLPLFSAPFIIQVHAIGAVLALLLSVLQFAGTKGTARHRAVGYAWVAIMMVVALSSFGIYSDLPMVGPYGPIHILSVITLVGVPKAVWAARRGKHRAHQLAMIQLVAFALVGAGLFAALSPGRVLYQMLFAG